eukprot:jgi/Bigna1/91502/estExt_fgenesh1_pg.C_1030020
MLDPYGLRSDEESFDLIWVLHRNVEVGNTIIGPVKKNRPEMVLTTPLTGPGSERKKKKKKKKSKWKKKRGSKKAGSSINQRTVDVTGRTVFPFRFNDEQRHVTLLHKGDLSHEARSVFLNPYAITSDEDGDFSGERSWMRNKKKKQEDKKEKEQKNCLIRARCKILYVFLSSPAKPILRQMATAATRRCPGLPRPCSLILPHQTGRRTAFYQFLPIATFKRRYLSATAESIRNIGIIAHVDAGKTTTTERMLFYAGKIRRPGDVDTGTTVTDFLEEERKRGITIQGPHQINIIDTPGHVDFTVEVERSVRALDGAVGIMDAVAGVQAQTETVWKQADKHRIPRIIFVNKMDRDDASVDICIESIKHRLPGITPIPLQIGEFGRDGDFDVVDLRSMTTIRWADAQGEKFEHIPVAAAAASSQISMEKATKERITMLETLADLDDEFCDIFLASEEGGGNNRIDVGDIDDALRRVTLGLLGVPVLCGASLKNRGVQPLLDAICRYLPSPLDSVPKVLETKDSSMEEHAETGQFNHNILNVTHDKHRGPLVFVRVYQGVLRPGASITSISPTEKEVVGTERVHKILQLDGEDVTELKELAAGMFVPDTRFTIPEKGGGGGGRRKGSSLPSFSVSWIPHSKFMPPVFYCSIEADSASEEKKLEEALKQMMLEDPSLFLEEDSETGQTLLKGMGELHLEVVHQRLIKDFGVGARLGRMRVAYRETLMQQVANSVELEHTLKQGKSQAAISLTISPMINEAVVPTSMESSQNVAVNINASIESDLERKLGQKMAQVFLEEIEDGVRNALSCGPSLGYPLVAVEVSIDSLDVTSSTQAVTCNAAAGQCTTQAIQGCTEDSCSQILEPIVKVTIRVPNDYMGSILSDIVEVTQLENQQAGGAAASLIHAENFIYVLDQHLANIIPAAQIPLAEMVGYATALRAMSQGNGNFEMSFLEYRYVGQDMQEKLMEDPYHF